MRLFVPGRVCLFGEHSDWAAGYRRENGELEKGYCLISGTAQGIHADAQPHPSRLILRSITQDGLRHGPVEIPMTPDRLLEEAQGGGFWSYVAGVAWWMRTRHDVDGLELFNDKTDLPVKKGLSSSAAICVLAARAFNRIYHLGLDLKEEMEIAFQGERAALSRCGRMDQGCAFGPQPVLMVFDGEDVEASEIVPGAPMHLVLVDLLGGKETLHILTSLNRAYPLARDPMERGLQESFGPINRRIVRMAVDALEAGDGETLGALMSEAQREFDRYAMPLCPEELTAPLLHRLLQDSRLTPLIWGGKGVGSQGDGAAQLLARDGEAQREIVELLGRDPGLPCLSVTLG